MKDIAVVGDFEDPNFIGSKPLAKAIKRIGLDPLRYQCTIWELYEERRWQY
jgi:hypothetical protein